MDTDTKPKGEITIPTREHQEIVERWFEDLFRSLFLHPPLLKIPIPLSTSRCEPPEGTFCTVTSCSPGSRATRVEEPTPSTSMAGALRPRAFASSPLPLLSSDPRSSPNVHPPSQDRVCVRPSSLRRRFAAQARGPPAPLAGLLHHARVSDFHRQQTPEARRVARRVRIASSPVRLAGAFPSTRPRPLHAQRG